MGPPRRLDSSSSSPVPEPRFKLAGALRASLREGYGRRDLVADLLAGVVVGIVALPLGMALAIASGVAPQHGLYTSVIAGALVAIAGGSRFSVTGPTAAFVALLAPISATYGLGGLLIATFMAGGILVGMGVARLGRLIVFVPHPVTAGFTAGVAIVIASLQAENLLGLDPLAATHDIFARGAAVWRASAAARMPDVVCGAVTLALLIAWPKLSKRIPAPLAALTLVTVAAEILRAAYGAELAPITIGDRFTWTAPDGATGAGVPPFAPTPVAFWHLPGGDGQPLVLDRALLRALLGPALAIAALGAIESLLCAVVADGMTGKRHDPDGELIAQGLGNLAAPFFGGIAATGAIARTATSVRSGARSPLASFLHALFVLAALLALSPLLSKLPMAGMGALLLIVAWNMADVRHVLHMVRVSPRSDMMILVACLLLTVVFDMVVAIGVGVVLGALLFMRRMADLTSSRALRRAATDSADEAGAGELIYEIAGPLFFGAADRAMKALVSVPTDVRRVTLRLDAVPVIDATGLIALEGAIEKLTARGLEVRLAGLRAEPRRLIERAGIGEQPGVTIESA